MIWCELLWESFTASLFTGLHGGVILKSYLAFGTLPAVPLLLVAGVGSVLGHLVNLCCGFGVAKLVKLYARLPASVQAMNDRMAQQLHRYAPFVIIVTPWNPLGAVFVLVCGLFRVPARSVLFWVCVSQILYMGNILMRW